MGLQINKKLNRVDGLEIPSGSVLSWDSRFIAGTRVVRFSPNYIFLSVADRDNYYNKVEGAPSPSLSGKVNELESTYDYEMSEEQYLALNTETGVMDTVQDYLKTRIIEMSEGYFSSSDIVIIPSFL